MTGAEFSRGVIVKGLGGLYYALDEAGEISVLRAKGKFRRMRLSPLVGDEICYSKGRNEEHGWIEEILPRRNAFARPPVANVDIMLIVIAPEPEPDYLLVDTLLVTAFQQGVTPVLVVNKCDISTDTAEIARREYSGLGAQVCQVSALTGAGLDELRLAASRGICCLAGQSGVGKSALLGALTGLDIKSGDISRRISRGKNTTRHVELIRSAGLSVLDTPGFSLLEPWEGLEPVKLKDYYPEFAAYEGRCRFAPCFHFSEPGCAVLEAAREGALNRGRLDRYHQLLDKVRTTWRERYD